METTLDPETARLRAWAEAVAENNLESAITAAEGRIEIERMKIEAFRKEAVIRAEMWRLLEADGIEADKLTLYQYTAARLKAKAIVDADAMIEAMEAKRNSAA
jgi:hypothetical protein